MSSNGDNLTNHRTLKVLFLAAEADPLIKVGGLGDVSGSLPRALNKLSSTETGLRLEIILTLPFHAGIDRSKLTLGGPIDFSVESVTGTVPGKAFPTTVDGLHILLIAGPPVPAEGPVYSMDTQADGDKFTFAALGALEAVRAMGWQPDILHANDWHTAMAVYAVSLRRSSDPFYQRIKTVLTVHNMPFIGVGTAPSLAKFGLPPLKDAGLPWWAEQLPLPVGLASADRIVAVSPGYSAEILTPAYGGGLEDFLQTRKSVITGILNGIDTAGWNPETDDAVAYPFNLNSLDTRKKNKNALRESLSLAGADADPIMAFIGRMHPQKGVDLVFEALQQIPDLHLQAVILGSGDPTLEMEASLLADAFPGRVIAVLRFDNRLARQLYAGADMLIMPSRYEPCGLAQMIAMRYGCIPVARRTGGLKDTILPYPEDCGGTGFLFDEASPEALGLAIQQALDIFQDKTTWRGLQTRGMQKDFSWQCSALAYAQLYKQIGEEP